MLESRGNKEWTINQSLSWEWEWPVFTLLPGWVTEMTQYVKVSVFKTKELSLVAGNSMVEEDNQLY